MKKILLVIWVVAALFIVVNIHPYIYYYNKGNEYYQKEEYDKACEKYEKALTYKLPESKECKIRINLALAMVAPVPQVPSENVDEESVENTIEILEDARDVLTKHGCANSKNDSGHDIDAQVLKNEIDVYLEELERETEHGGTDEAHPNGKEDSNRDGEDEIQKKLEEKQKQGIGERFQSVEGVEYEYTPQTYYGDFW